MLDARDRRGRPIECGVSIAPLVGRDGEIEGVILAMIARPRQDTAD